MKRAAGPKGATMHSNWGTLAATPLGAPPGSRSLAQRSWLDGGDTQIAKIACNASDDVGALRSVSRLSDHRGAMTTT